MASPSKFCDSSTLGAFQRASLYMLILATVAVLNQSFIRRFGSGCQPIDTRKHELKNGKSEINTRNGKNGYCNSHPSPFYLFQTTHVYYYSKLVFLFLKVPRNVHILLFWILTLLYILTQVWHHFLVAIFNNEHSNKDPAAGTSKTLAPPEMG